MTESSGISFSSPFTFDWVIPNISKLVEICSPEYVIHHTPWEVKVRKTTVAAKDYLGIYLQDTYKSRSNWSHAAAAEIRLLTVDKDNGGSKSLKIYPWVFVDTMPAWGFTRYLSWDDLFDPQNKYVKDDKITLRATIEVDSAGDNKSILNFESLGQFCECSGMAKFRLMVSNIDHLFAARSPAFEIRDQPWFLTVYNESKSLGIRMFLNTNSNAVSCKATITVKLISTQNEVTPIEKSCTNICDKIIQRIVDIRQIISWDELLKPQNGYVQNDAITMEVDVKVEKPTFSVANTMKRQANETHKQAKSIILECAICKTGIVDQDVSSISCGHIFCTACITYAIYQRKICPIKSCNKAVSRQGLRRIILPM